MWHYAIARKYLVNINECRVGQYDRASQVWWWEERKVDGIGCERGGGV